MARFLSLFIIFSTLYLVLGLPLKLSDSINTSEIQNLINNKVLPLTSLISKLTDPPKGINDILKPLFPAFGDLAAPRAPSLEEPKANPPLNNYTVKELKAMSTLEAKKLRDDLVGEELRKKIPSLDKMTYLHMLDEALYNVGISLDIDVNFIEHKIKNLSEHGIKNITSLIKKELGKETKLNDAEKQDLTKQLLRRYVIFSKLTYLKRYIDQELKKLVSIF